MFPSVRHILESGNCKTDTMIALGTVVLHQVPLLRRLRVVSGSAQGPRGVVPSQQRHHPLPCSLQRDRALHVTGNAPAGGGITRRHQ